MRDAWDQIVAADSPDAVDPWRHPLQLSQLMWMMRCAWDQIVRSRAR